MRTVAMPCLAIRKVGAFTLIETICVMVILAVLMALTFPVVVNSIREGKVSVSVARLHQLHMAFSLYRSENEGDGKYGPPEEMGLPNGFFLTDPAGEKARSAVTANKQLWQSPCKSDTSEPINYNYRPMGAIPNHPELMSTWADYSRTYQEQSVYIFDENCNDPNIDVYDITRTEVVRLIGLCLDGSIMIKQVGGNVLDNELWNR